MFSAIGAAFAAGAIAGWIGYREMDKLKRKFYRKLARRLRAYGR